MSSFWVNAGKLVVNAAGDPVWCATCPCGVLACCCNATTAGPGLAPSTLFITLSNTGCIDGTYQLDFRNPSAPFLQFPVCWESAEQACGYNSFFLCLSCNTATCQWQLTVLSRLSGGAYAGSNSVTGSIALMSCSPYHLTGSPPVTWSGTTACGTLSTSTIIDATP